MINQGDLSNYLRSNSPSNYIVRSSDGSNLFTDVKISHIGKAKQKTSGMWIRVEKIFPDFFPVSPDFLFFGANRRPLEITLTARPSSYLCKYIGV